MKLKLRTRIEYFVVWYFKLAVVDNISADGDRCFIDLITCSVYFCIDYGVYTSLSGILMILAECYYHLKDHEKSIELYRQSYYLFKIIEDERNLAIIKTEAKKFLGLELD